MPIYEFKCPQGHLFEVFQRMDEAPPEACVECGEGPMQRVLYPVAVHFKGSGFYSTDYGRGNRKKDGAKPDDGTSDSADAKPATTGDGGSSDKAKAAD